MHRAIWTDFRFNNEFMMPNEPGSAAAEAMRRADCNRGPDSESGFAAAHGQAFRGWVISSHLWSIRVAGNTGLVDASVDNSPRSSAVKRSLISSNHSVGRSALNGPASPSAFKWAAGTYAPKVRRL